MQQAGTFLNGPDRDKGPPVWRSIMLRSTGCRAAVSVSGQRDLPGAKRLSFQPYPATGVLVDPDGDGSVNGIDVDAGRNAFTAPPFVNPRHAFHQRFNITGRVKVDVLLEFFNMLNRQNPAAVGRPRV